MIRRRFPAIRLLPLSIVANFLTLCSEPPAKQLLEERWELARKTYREDGPATALPIFEELVEDFREVQDRAREAEALGQVGNCYKHLGQYDRALEFLTQARELNVGIGNRSEEGWVINSIGLVFWEMADYDRALKHLTEAEEVARASGDRRLEATTLNNRGLVYDELGNYDRSRDLYGQALEVFRELKDRYREGYVLGNIGGVLLLTGDFREAAEVYNQALEISQELESKPAQAIDKGNLGLCLLGMGRLDEANRQFDEALLLSRESGQVKEQADWRHGKASLYLRTGDYPAALTEYLTALEIYSEAGLRRQEVEALAQLGQLRLLLGDPASAETSFRQGRDLARSIGHARGELLLLIQLGDLQLRRRDFEEGLRLFERALEVAEETGDNLNQTVALVRKAVALRRLDRPADSLESAQRALRSVGDSGAIFEEAEARLAVVAALQDLGRFRESLVTLDDLTAAASVQKDPEVNWRLLHSRGHALEGLGRRAEALDAYSDAVDVLQSVRYRLREAGVANSYLEDRYEPYLDLVRVSIRAGLNEKAYQASLRLRLRSYRDMLDRDPSSAVPVDQQPELGEKISHLRQVIEQRKSLLVEDRQTAAIEHLIGALSEAQKEYEEQLSTQQVGGGWRETLNSMGVPRLREIQALLPADSAVVEYVLSADAVHTFVIRNNALHTRSVPANGNQLLLRVELLRNLLSKGDTGDWLRPSQRLHDLLIRPLEVKGWLDGADKLYIVPHRVLHYLPFAVLARVDEKAPHPVVQDYEVSYLPSSLLFLPQPESQAPASLLAMAPQRASLRFHKEEVQGLAASFTPPLMVLVGSAATESLFKKSAMDYRVIHLATHSRFNRWNPLLSALDLEADDQDDGDLQVREIIKMQLHAGLVCLSACNTGLGSGHYSDLPSGDEFVGLTQAFLSAGAGAVLASYWEIDDRSTSRFMQLFYSQLEKKGAAAALAQAQRQMFSQSHSHPRTWGGFALFGGIRGAVPERSETSPF